MSDSHVSDVTTFAKVVKNGNSNRVSGCHFVGFNQKYQFVS